MSRLYGRLQSDRRKTDATVGANNYLSSKITWGSASNPKVALDVSITWDKEDEYPHLIIDIPDDIDVIVYDSGGPQFARKLN